jgi:subfamily B ATP-binding cassette protein MsbA
MGYKNFTSRLFYYLKPHVGKLVFTSLMMIFATVLEGSIPEITGRIIDDLFVGERNTQTALLYAGILLAVITASSIFALTSTATSSWVSNKVIMDLRANMFAKLLTCHTAHILSYFSTGIAHTRRR